MLCKSLGSSNYINIAKATVDGLPSAAPARRDRRCGVSPVDEIIPAGLLRAYQESERGPAPEPTEVA